MYKLMLGLMQMLMTDLGVEGTKGITTNIHQYQLSHLVLDSFICDASRLPFRPSFLDAIITDPPYGVRAGAKKIKPRSSASSKSYPETEIYPMQNVVSDLINFSWKLLKMNGRLVFWLPTFTEEFSVRELPECSGMRVKYQCVQVFGKWSRVMIVMEKVGEYEEGGVRSEMERVGHTDFRGRYFAKKEKL